MYELAKNAKNLTNMKFNELTALYPIGQTKDHRVLWKCKCDCGNDCEVSSKALLNGSTKSCGCRNKRVRQEWGRSTAKDLSNQRFGKLIALYPLEQRSSKGEVYWRCKCDCGNEKDIKGTNLSRGATQSCGCMTQSHGEFAVEQLLKDNNIQYQAEYLDKACVLPTGGYAKFDFKCKWHEIIYYIEFDGNLHYYTTNNGWNTEQHLQETKKRDFAKNIYCLNNNIPLIRISYTHLNDLTIEDLLPTSSFIIKDSQGGLS